MTEYKGFYIKPFPSCPSLLQIVTTGRGGKIPRVMEGLFTSYGYAKGLIDTYLETKPAEEPVNDKKLVKRGV